MVTNGFKYFICSPRKLGKISNLTSRFFRWGGSTTNQLALEDDDSFEGWRLLLLGWLESTYICIVEMLRETVMLFSLVVDARLLETCWNMVMLHQCLHGDFWKNSGLQTKQAEHVLDFICTNNYIIQETKPNRIHVWCIYLHLAIYHTWILWVWQSSCCCDSSSGRQLLMWFAFPSPSMHAPGSPNGKLLGQFLMLFWRGAFCDSSQRNCLGILLVPFMFFLLD